MTLDAAERLLSLPTQVSQKAILAGHRTKAARKKPTPLSSRGTRRQWTERKKRRNTFVCRDLNMLPFSHCLPPFLAAPPQRLAYWRKHAAGSELPTSPPMAAHKKRKQSKTVFELLCAVISGQALARAEWSGLCDMGVKATQTSAGSDFQ